MNEGRLMKIWKMMRFLLDTNYTNKEGLEIDLNVTDEKVAQNILEELTTPQNIKVVLYNRSKQNREESILKEQYKEAIEWRGHLIGDIQFFNLATFALALIINWTVRHILEDIDDKVWDKVKELVKKVFSPVKNEKKKNEKIPFVISSEKNKKIVFLFDTSMTMVEFEDAFKKIKKSLKSLNDSDLNKELYRPLIFQFNLSKGKWEKERKKENK